MLRQVSSDIMVACTCRCSIVMPMLLDKLMAYTGLVDVSTTPSLAEVGEEPATVIVDLLPLLVGLIGVLITVIVVKGLKLRRQNMLDI